MTPEEKQQALESIRRIHLEINKLMELVNRPVGIEMALLQKVMNDLEIEPGGRSNQESTELIEKIKDSMAQQPTRPAESQLEPSKRYILESMSASASALKLLILKDV